MALKAVSGGSGSGTVTAVSVSTANGFAGSSSGGTTPALTLTTTVTGVLKGNATTISAATAGTDYSAGTSALGTGILKSTTGTGALTIAVSGTDYAPATSGTSILKASSGGFANAVAGTDYIAPGGIGSNVTAVVTTQYDATSNTTLTNVPGLSVNLTTGQTYTFELHIYSNNGNTAGGVKINLAGTATASAFIGHCLSFANTGASTGGPTFYQTAFPTSSAGVTPGAGICEMVLTGYFACNGTGTLTFQFAQNASSGTASSVFVGSYMNVVRIT